MSDFYKFVIDSSGDRGVFVWDAISDPDSKRFKPPGAGALVSRHPGANGCWVYVFTNRLMGRNKARHADCQKLIEECHSGIQSAEEELAVLKETAADIVELENHPTVQRKAALEARLESLLERLARYEIEPTVEVQSDVPVPSWFYKQ